MTRLSDDEVPLALLNVRGKAAGGYLWTVVLTAGWAAILLLVALWASV